MSVVLKTLTKPALYVQVFPFKISRHYQCLELSQTPSGTLCKFVFGSSVNLSAGGAAGMAFVRRGHAGHGQIQLAPKDPPQDTAQPFTQDGGVFKMVSACKKAQKMLDRQTRRRGKNNEQQQREHQHQRSRCCTEERIIPEGCVDPTPQQIFLKVPWWKRGEMHRERNARRKKWEKQTVMSWLQLPFLIPLRCSKRKR